MGRRGDIARAKTLTMAPIASRETRELRLPKRGGVSYTGAFANFGL